MKGESSNGGSLREEPTEDLALLGQLGINIPPASDFAAIMRVYECSSRIAEVAEDSLKILLLRKTLKKAEAVNSNLHADLLDRQEKLDYYNTVLVPDLLEDNRYLRGVIDILSNAEEQIAEAERQLATRSAEAGEVPLVEEELEVARRLESEANAKVAALCQQVQLLESELKGEEEMVARARSEGFLHDLELVLVQDPGVEPELLSIVNEVIGKKIVRLREDGEPEILFDPSNEEQ